MSNRTGPLWMQRRHDPGAKPPPNEEEQRRKLEPLLRRYEEQRQEPIEDDLAVFGAYWYSALSCNPRAIYDALGVLQPNVRRVWVVNRRLARRMPAGIDYVVGRTAPYFEVLAHARWFVNNVNFPDHFVKRPGTVHVQTHHGTPLKLMGLDQVTGPQKRTDLNVENLLRRCARWDYSLSSNRYSTEIWKRTYPVEFESLEYGYPRNDVLARATAADTQRAREELGIPAGKQVILFAPTHREYHDTFVPTVDLARLAGELGDGVVLLTRLHYAYGDVPYIDELSAAGRVVDVSAHPSVEQLYLAADVLVTDYSSTMFDYGVLDRPIVIHVPDWEEYQARRGTYLDITAEGPGVVTRSDDELIDAIRSGGIDSAAARERRAAFRARFCSLDDGHAAERVIERVWSR